ncbi:MAG: thiol reductant ABC exporter subunit CydC [Rhodospirillaceae bacterium]|nr:thiol reductant ABC exporter subunit CydC [Rhodospirillaceae bacterium]
MYFDRRLWQFTEGLRLRIAGAVVLGLLSAAVGIARLALLGWLLGRVFQGESFGDLILPIVAVAAAMVARGALEYWRTMAAHHTAALVQLQIRARLFDRIAALGPGQFGGQRSGEVLLSVIDGVEQLETYFGQYLPQLFVAAVTPFGIFAFAAFLDLPLAGVLLGFALLTLVAPVAFHHWDQISAKARQEAYAAYGAELLDSVQGLATLKAFGQSGARGRFLAEKAHDLFRSTMWVLASNSASRGITDAGIAVGAAAALGIGAARVIDGTIGIEVLLIVLMMGVEVFRPMRDLRALLHTGMHGRSAAASLFRLLDTKPAIEDADGAADAAPLAPTLAFEDVHFAYPGGRRPAHDGLSFEVGAGERVGIVGASGAGKSTILRLLMRFDDPQRGRILLGGQDLRTLDRAALRARFGVVNQDTYLFHGTAAENIRFGKPDASDAEIEAAARAANAHGFIARLPQGYDTVIGERGIRLSGGQRQRIAIARALLRDAPILLLDEALSSVDAENEAVIQDALGRLMGGRTVLIMAHRLSSVIDADRILVLDEGRVVESGRHAELMAKRGVYHRLMADQVREGLEAPPTTAPGAEPATEPTTEDRHLAAVTLGEPADEVLRAEGLGWWSAWMRLLGLVRPFRGRVNLAFGLGVARVVAFIGVGVLSALVVAGIKQGTPVGGLLIALYAVAPLAGVLHWLESWVAHDMAFRLLTEMRIALYDKLDRLAPAYLLRRRTGDIVGMATQDVELVEYFFAHTVAPALVAILVPAAVVATLLVYGWPTAAALAPFILLVGLSPFLLRKRLDRLGGRAREMLGLLNAHAVDTIQGLTELLAFGQQAARRKVFLGFVRGHHRVRIPYYRDLTFQMALIETATGLGGLAVVMAGTAWIAAGWLEAAMLPLLAILAMATFLPVSEIAHIGRQLADTLGATRRLHAVHSARIAVADGPGARPAPGAPALEMEGVSFTYVGTGRPALSDVTLTVRPGETLALVGPSGAGKTTVAHLFMRFWDPAEGTVRLDGEDVRQWTLDALRARIALVAQDTYLFNDTLRANILIARPDASEAELGEAVRRAALEDFVAALPEGLETRVGERGTQLSGGQRQRVAVARAVLKNAPILILDEATSHLDAVNEAMLRRALTELMAERTTVVIAHRLSTVRDADTIVVLDDGRIAETGSHDALLARAGLYSQLVTRQLAAAGGGRQADG